MNFPGGAQVKNPPANAGDPDLIPGLGRYPGVGNGNLLQHSCLKHSMDRGAWQATVHGVTKNWTQLSLCTCVRTHTHTHTHRYTISVMHQSMGHDTPSFDSIHLQYLWCFNKYT